MLLNLYKTFINIKYYLVKAFIIIFQSFSFNNISKKNYIK
jgi:hypothetical protein